jgi:hypothetical protein
VQRRLGSEGDGLIEEVCAREDCGEGGVEGGGGEDEVAGEGALGGDLGNLEVLEELVLEEVGSVWGREGVVEIRTVRNKYNYHH